MNTEKYQKLVLFDVDRTLIINSGYGGAYSEGFRKNKNKERKIKVLIRNINQGLTKTGISNYSFVVIK